MQVKAVEVAKSNSKSEFTFQLVVAYGLYLVVMLLVTSCFIIGRQLESHWVPADM